MIFSFLDYDDILNMVYQVSHEFQRCAQQPLVWRTCGNMELNVSQMKRLYHLAPMAMYHSIALNFKVYTYQTEEDDEDEEDNPKTAVIRAIARRLMHEQDGSGGTLAIVNPLLLRSGSSLKRLCLFAKRDEYKNHIILNQIGDTISSKTNLTSLVLGGPWALQSSSPEHALVLPSTVQRLHIDEILHLDLPTIVANLPLLRDICVRGTAAVVPSSMISSVIHCSLPQIEHFTCIMGNGSDPSPALFRYWFPRLSTGLRSLSTSFYQQTDTPVLLSSNQWPNLRHLTLQACQPDDINYWRRLISHAHPLLDVLVLEMQDFTINECDAVLNWPRPLPRTIMITGQATAAIRTMIIEDSRVHDRNILPNGPAVVNCFVYIQEGYVAWLFTPHSLTPPTILPSTTTTASPEDVVDAAVPAFGIAAETTANGSNGGEEKQSLPSSHKPMDPRLFPVPHFRLPPDSDVSRCTIRTRLTISVQSFIYKCCAAGSWLSIDNRSLEAQARHYGRIPMAHDCIMASPNDNCPFGGHSGKLDPAWMLPSSYPVPLSTSTSSLSPTTASAVLSTTEPNGAPPIPRDDVFSEQKRSPLNASDPTVSLSSLPPASSSSSSSSSPSPCPCVCSLPFHAVTWNPIARRFATDPPKILNTATTHEVFSLRPSPPTNRHGTATNGGGGGGGGRAADAPPFPQPPSSILSLHPFVPPPF
jgi:hypothetical protein